MVQIDQVVTKNICFGTHDMSPSQSKSILHCRMAKYMFLWRVAMTFTTGVLSSVRDLLRFILVHRGMLNKCRAVRKGQPSAIL